MGYSNSVLAGASYTVSVAINGALVNNAPRTGTLSLVEGTNTLASINLATSVPAASFYQYTLTVTGGLATGTHNLKVVYSGDARYSASTVSMAPGHRGQRPVDDFNFFAVARRADLFAERLHPDQPGNESTPPTGTLSLVEGSATLASICVGSATLSSSGQAITRWTVPGGLAAVLNSMKLIYSGDSNYAAATDPVLGVTGVSTLSTSLGLGYVTALNAGQSFTVDAGINGTVESGVPRTGTLSLMEGTTTLATVNVGTTTPANGGYYFLTVPGGFPIGTYNLSVTYSGDGNYGSSTANLAPLNIHIPSTSIGLELGHATGGSVVHDQRFGESPEPQ